MGRRTKHPEWKLAGDRPVLGPVLTGMAGLLGGVLIGRLGVWVALAIVGPIELGDPMDLFGNAIRLLGPLLVLGAGAVAGFLLGTVALPALVMFGLGWDRAGRTVGYLLLLWCGVVPLTFWILLQTGGGAESTGGGLWLAGMVVGGLSPGVARALARRSRPNRAGRARSRKATETELCDDAGVTSWRDSASSQAQDDLDELLGASLPFAQEMLDRRGEFYPYAAATAVSGETNLIAGDPGDGEQPTSVAVIEVLVEGLRADRDTLRATAVVSDVRRSDSDAVRVELEHVEGHAIVVFLPYRTRRLRRGVEYGQITASPGELRIWA